MLDLKASVLFFFNMIYYYYYLQIYCDQRINILCLLELIQMSPVRTRMVQFLFVVVALSLNLLLVTGERVESECMKQAERVTVWFSASVDHPCTWSLSRLSPWSSLC